MTATFVVVATGFLAGYMFLHLSLMKLVQPLRLDLARRGEEFLARDDASAANKVAVRVMLVSAYSPMFMVYFALLYPIFSGVLLFSRSAREKMVEAESRSEDARNAFSEICKLFYRSTAAANPIFAGLVWAERVIAIALVALFHAPLATVKQMEQRSLLRYGGADC